MSARYSLKGKTEREKGILALIALAFGFAFMGVFIRYLQTDFTIIQQTYLRIFAALLLGVAIFYKDLHVEKLKRVSGREWLVLILRSVSLYAIGVTFLTAAFITTKYANVSFISELPATAVLGFLFLKEKVTFSKIAYIFLSVVGVGLIAIQDYSHLLNWGQGEVAALIASIAFGVSYIARKWQSDLLNNKEIAVIIFFIGGILLFVISLVHGEGLPRATSFSSATVLVIGGAGLFNVINLFLTNYGFQKVEAVLASNLLMLEAFFGVLLGFIFYQELPSARGIIGGALIVFSAYQIHRHMRKQNL